MSNAANFFSEDEKQRISEAIAEAERMTSGEIRVHVENSCPGDPYERAVVIFEKLGMQATSKRNGVLLYVAVKSHDLAIIGDKGINEAVPENFWDDILAQLKEDFRAGRAAEGVCKALRKAGEQLKAHFPFEDGDVNEQPDALSHE